MLATFAETLAERKTETEPANESVELQPPPAGSVDELLETAAVVGYPGALLHSCRDCEQRIRALLLWEE